MAARKFFTEGIEIVPCDSFQSSCYKLLNGEADYCVMAVENSITGVLNENEELIRRNKFQILRHVDLPIRLHLMTLRGVEMKDVKEIHSHPVAIQQCKSFFDQYPSVKAVEKKDTASCAKEMVKNNFRDVAVIAGDAVATHFSLQIIFHNIESAKNNFTRFVLLAPQQLPLLSNF